MNTILESMKRYFVGGVLVVVPLILTYIVLRFLFEAIDGVLRPLLQHIFGYYVPGLGVVTTLLIIVLAGVATRNYVGARLVSITDRMLSRMPIIRPIHSAAKQLLTAVTAPQTNTFQQVALVHLPNQSVYMLCFVSKRLSLVRGGRSEEFAVIFVPSTPAPLSGFTALAPASDVSVLDLTTEDALKYFVSGGVAAPDTLWTLGSRSEPASSGVIRETR